MLDALLIRSTVAAKFPLVFFLTAFGVMIWLKIVFAGLAFMTMPDVGQKLARAVPNRKSN